MTNIVSVAKKLSSPFRTALAGVFLVVAHFRRFLPNVRKTWAGTKVDPDGRKFAVVVHFDKHGSIADYLFHTFAELTDAGYQIILVSNAPKLKTQDVELARSHVHSIIHRYNSGYDFAAYRDGLAAVPDVDRLESLIIMNDSVYGPLFSLKEQLSTVSPDSCDVWGITDSWERRYHVQSYFMLFHATAIQSKAFCKFWKYMPNHVNKWAAIQNGELKLTNKLAGDKLRIAVQCPYWDVVRSVSEARSRSDEGDKDADGKIKIPTKQWENKKAIETALIGGNPINQSHFFWETLIEDYKCLFLKRELIHSNPIGTPYPWRWRDVVKKQTNFDPELIERHLQSL
ncbi:MAG: rhamnan synthesis F family protein [Pseudomonadota bacterium]